MTSNTKLVGDQGENMALEYLLSKGYILIGRNIKLVPGEIDLLFKDNKTLVLVEVKTKTNDSYGIASDMITLKKKRKLLQLAKFINQKYPKTNLRIDVIAIDNNKIEHIISAVQED